MDTAVCNRHQRGPFLALISKCYVVNTNITQQYYEERYEWMLLRGIGMRKLCIKNRNIQLPTKLLEILKKTKCLHFLEAPGTVELDYLIRTCNLDILAFKLVSNVTDKDLKEILSCLPELSHIDTSSCFGLSDLIYAQVISNCSQLRSIRPPPSADISSVIAKCEIQRIIHGDIVRLLRVTEGSGCLSKYFGDFSLTNDSDASVATIADKKFHLNSLEVMFGTEDDNIEFMGPLLKQVQSITLSNTASTFLFKNIAFYCSRLVSFTAHAMFSETPHDLISILQHSSQLLRLELKQCLCADDNVYFTVAEHCHQLQSLTSLSSNIRTELLTKIVDNLTNLTEVVVDLHKGMSAQVIRVCSNAEALVVHYTVDNRLSLIPDMFHKLQRFTLSGSFSEFSVFHARLQSIEFLNQPYVKSDTIEQVVKSCPHLTRLVLSMCRSLTANCMEHIAKCVHLQSLYLSDQRKITDAMIEALLRDKPEFVKLALPYAAGLTGESMRMVAKYCPKLKHLDMSSNKNIKSLEVIEVLHACTSLDCLIIEGCANVTEDILPSLRNMRVLNVRRTGISNYDLNGFFNISKSVQCSCELKM